MTLRRAAIGLAVVAVVAAGLLLGAGRSVARAAAYVEDPSDIRNPERGFYRKGYVNLLSTDYAGNAAKMAEIYALLGQTILYSRMTLAAYRDLDHLPSGVIDALSINLANLRNTGLKAGLRFHYGGGGTADATKARMLNHIADLAPVFQAYGDVIAYLEGGFIGDIGQWTNSENLDTNPTNDSTCGNRDVPDVIDALMTAVPSDRMVLMSHPRMQGRSACTPYDTSITPGSAYDSSNRSRLGIYNDGILCGKHNGGTFWCKPFAQEESYWDRQSDFTLTVGEGNGLNMGTCAGGDACPKGYAPVMSCSSDSACVYQGVDYGPCVLDWNRCTKGMAFAARHNITATDDGVAWTGSSIMLDGLRTDSPECFAELSKKLGYRYVLTEATWPDSVAAGGTTTIGFTLRNDGFARLYNPRTAYVSLVNGQTRRDIALATDPRHWSPNGATSTVSEDIEIPGDLPPGTYDIALWLPDAGPLLRDDARYAIRFANDGTWDPVVGLNVLGTLTVSPSSPVTTTTTTLASPTPTSSTTTTTLPAPTTTTTTVPAPTTTTTLGPPTTTLPDPTTTTLPAPTTTTVPAPTTTTTLAPPTTTTVPAPTTTTTLAPPAASVRIDEASMTSVCAGTAADTVTIPGVTVGNQPNRMLVVTVGAEEANADCDLGSPLASVTYGQATLARATSAVSDTNSWRACNGIFYLINPPAGVADVLVRFPAAASGAIDNRHAGALVLYDVAQQPPTAIATAGADATTDPVVTAVTASAANALAIDVITQGETGSFAPTEPNQTERWDRSCVSSGSASSTRAAESPGALTLGWDHSSPKRYAHSLAVFAPAGDASATTTTSSTSTTTTSTTSTTTITLPPPGTGIGVDAGSVRTACGAAAADAITIPAVPVGTQANRVLVVTVGAEENDADCNLASPQLTVRYGGTLLTRAVAALSDTTSWRTCNGVFYLLNAPTGTADVVVTFPSTTTNRVDNRHAGAMVLYGAAQAAPEAIASAGADATTNPIVTSIVATTPQALIVDVVTQGDTGSFAPTEIGQTEWWETSCGSSSSATSIREAAGPGSLPLGWSHTSARRYAHALAAFRPAP